MAESTQRIGAVRENGHGRRWYDASKVMAALFIAVLFFVMAWAGIVWSCARAGELKNVQQDEQIKTLSDGFKDVGGKLDRILERLPPK
jgi:uncharacterized iron-regulated membrane protein